MRRKAIGSTELVSRCTREAVYQECLRKEFALCGIPFEEKQKVALFYKGEPLEQTYQPDFVCSGRIIVELKAVKMVADEHRAQVINYLKSSRMELGLLVNFGHFPKVELERFINQ